MLDAPTPDELLASVAAFLRDVVVVEAAPRTAFQARVAVRAIDLVRRELALRPTAEAAERTRLAALLNRDGSLAELNAALAAEIAAGRLTAECPGTMAHLRATSLEKLAVDQPDYSGYRDAMTRAAAQEEA